MPAPDDSPIMPNDTTFRVEWTADGHVLEDALYAWLDGALDAADADAVAAHTDACPTCSAALAEARGVMAASLRILGEADGVPRDIVPPADVRRTADRIARTAPPPRGTSTPWWRDRRVAAAAAVLLMAGTAYVGTRNANDTSRPVADTSVAADKVGPDADVVASAQAGAAAAPAAEPAMEIAAERTAPTASAPSPTASVAKASAPAPEPAAARRTEGAATSEQRVARENASDVAVVPSAPPPAPSAATAARATAARATADRSAPRSPVYATLTGRVLDANDGDRPVAGASVAIPGTALGTLTDAEGRFTLDSVPRAASTLIARRIGYEARTAPLSVGASFTDSIDIRLAPSLTRLSSVVVAVDTPAIAPAPLAFACLVPVRDSAASAPPPVRAIRGPLRGAGTHRLVVIGWPDADAERRATFTLGDDGWLRGTVRSGDARLEVTLFGRDSTWSGSVTETRGARERSTNTAFVATTRERCMRER